MADLSEPEQVFVLARPLIAIAKRIHAVEKLTPRELEVSLAATCRQVNPTFGTGLTNEEFLDERKKKIFRGIPRRSRKSVEGLARAYVDAGDLDFPRWVDDMCRITRRLAALLSDDLVACVDVIRSGDRELAELSGPELVDQCPEVEDIMRFWVTEAAIAIRERVGLLEPAAT